MKPTIPPGAIPMKQWLAEQSAATGIAPRAIQVNIRHHRLPLATLRLNGRVVYVLPHQHYVPGIHISPRLTAVPPSIKP